ncbi:MAG: Zn-dependent dehydrogenase [Oscillospiraceae bacterium]|nr:Zn-dependent dehydrogenase [Oscillospiraceae bacterium]
MKQTMKALIYKGIEDIELVEKDRPLCGPDDVIVRNIRSGICGTDITGYKYGGEKVYIFPGREFGHEMVGEVCEKGEHVQGLEIGSRVFVDPNYSTPDPYESDMAGAFSQYVRVWNAALGHNLYLLPEELSYEDAVLIEPFSVATHGKNTAQVKPDENVLIIGAGTIGLCALSSLIAQGNQKVVVLDIDDDRLALAEKMGGTGFNSNKGNDAVFQFLSKTFGLMENTNHRLDIAEDGSMEITSNAVWNIDAVIDCAGANDIVDEYMKHAKQRSRFCCIALHKGSVPIRFHEIMSTQCAIMGSRGYDRIDIEEVISNLTRKNSKVTEMITHKFPLSDAVQAFKTAADPSVAVKVVLDMEN